ncbi:MAG: class I SAM-dependent methyltransferase [bacterium]|nr:class I SAM-dependent methyltransferase [bacterium]
MKGLDLHSLADLLSHDDLSSGEAYDTARLIEVFADADPPPDHESLFPSYSKFHDRLTKAVVERQTESIEEAFLALYELVHMTEAHYTREERHAMDRSGGYWAHAGGISPIIRARPFLSSRSISTDLGAGNGLQCLLLQRLFPHRLSIQIEISSQMVEIGKRLQEWLRIPKERVEWRTADILDAEIPDADFVYLYRPVRPEGPGRSFYERLSSSLENTERHAVVFSIADCLRDFLSDRFERIYYDGQLSCFANRPNTQEKVTGPESEDTV